MANTEENKELSLSDLGIEESTPAEEAANEAVQNDQPPVTSQKVEPVNEIKEEGKTNPKIAKPDKGKHGSSKYSVVSDVHKFLGTKPAEKPNPIKDTWDYMNKITDENIERTKEDLKRAGGRIEQAKIKAVEYYYPMLVERAKHNDRLQKKINKLREMMDANPVFDSATEIEKRGYIIWVLTKRNDIGVDNEYFGIEESKEPETGRRLSNENNKFIDQIIDMYNDKEDIDLFDDNASVTLGENKTPSEPIRTSSTSEKPDTSKSVVADNMLDEDEEVKILEETTSNNEESTDEDEEDMMSEEQRKEIQKEYRSQLVTALNLTRLDDLDGFVVESKPIELKSALVSRKVEPNSYAWPLLYTGTVIEMTPFENDEIMQLNPQNSDFETVQGLNTVFNILYHHIVNPNKPKFETWLRQVVDFDIDALIFAGHAATFRDTNYLTYECTNPKCKKVFLQKKDIMDMVEFANDDVKKRFDEILEKDTVMKQTYTTKPKRISEHFAIGFTSQSIYSNLFEPASLPTEFAKKYSQIISVMPFIDVVYKIDAQSRKLYPIRFGVDTSSLSKTVQRKVRALNLIFKAFTPDERALVIGESQKISNQMNKWKMNYVIPETVCPHCGETIAKRESNPLNILFTRAQLPLVAAYIPE